MNTLKHLFIPLFFVLSIFACGDDDSPTPSGEPDPTDTMTVDTNMVDTNMMDSSKICLYLFDAAGAAIGTYGDCGVAGEDLQWKNNPNLTEEQRAFFDFPETSPASDLGTVSVSEFLIYPMPVPDGRVTSIGLIANSTNTVKIKLVFTDIDDQPIREMALTIGANGAAQLMLEEVNFPFGAYRLYYQVLSNGDSEVVFEGYGNIAVCDAWPVTDVEGQCFE